MDIDKIPIIGNLNRTFNILMVNFLLLGVVCAILGVAIIFFPVVLDILIAALLIFAALIFFHIAYNIYSTKKKYTKWLQ